MPPGLKAALKRGALVAAANWPLVAVQFVAESTLKLLLARAGGRRHLPGRAAARRRRRRAAGRRRARDRRGGLQRDAPERRRRWSRSPPPSLVVLLGGSALTFVVKGGHRRRCWPTRRRRPDRSNGRRCSLQALRRANVVGDRAVPRRLPAAVAALRQARRLPAARLRGDRRGLSRVRLRRLRAGRELRRPARVDGRDRARLERR